ncbi:MAG: Wzz/FepE/Etk N-terminal domain-containing protein, partial [Methylocella sp.]
MEFYRVWRILAGNKWLLIWLPIIATCVGLGLTYVLPEQYESTALVLDRPFEDIKFDSSGGDKKEIPDFPVNLSAPIDSLSKTYKEEISSPAVAVKIVDALQLYVKKPKEYENSFEFIVDKVKTWVSSTVRTFRNYFKYGRDIHASPFELAVEAVEANLLVTATKDTYAFGIAYRSSNPKEAAAVANMAAK